MAQQQHLVDYCEDMARAGNGSFAVAFALLQLSRTHERGVRAIENLGMGTVDGQGALEMVASELKTIGESLETAATALASALTERK